MKYIIKGSLCGFLCEECSEPLGSMQVLLYLPWQSERITENVVANPKETFRLVSKEEKEQRKSLLIATSETDEKGNFQFIVDEKFSKSAFDIDFVCGSVPHAKPKPRKEALQFHITTFYPQWLMDKDQENYYFTWQYCIPSKTWCYVRGYYFDAWTICGHLTNCSSGSAIANATVKAWDADLITDDYLGSAVTDAAGHFRIDYTSADFKVNFIPLNLETDPSWPFLSSGPDVYFKADIGGVVLVNETAADRRNNVGYCLCVDLCSKINVGNPDDNFPSAWTGVGLAFDITTGTGARDFDTDGYAGTGKYALSGVIRLTGQAAPKAVSGNPIEYRFLVSDITTPNGGAAPAIGNFAKIVGVTPGLFYTDPSQPVAKLMQKVFPFSVYPVLSDQSDFDAEGWFDINKSVARTITTYGLTSLNDYWFIDEDTLLSMNTGALTTFPDVPTGAANAGTAVPAANKIPLQKIAIRFEIREVVNKALNQFNIIAGSGKTLNSAIINNNSVFMKLSIAELETLGSCTPISGTIHAKYTIYHPHLESAFMHLNNNSYSVNRDITDGFLTLAGNINPAVDGNANNSLQLNNPPNDMTKCTYSLKLYVQPRLHNGDNAAGYSGPVEQLFFYNI